MSAAPERYTVTLKPRLADEEGHPDHGSGLRSATVHATGGYGASGAPRYTGEGIAADIDPTTGTVQAITVDGRELPYGWVAETTPDSED
ncbi:hypothetical protein [Streptomyces sp. NPDC058045]|uniref:hypothetical protein n=1 Tax=Streptomyces sp. NPDC058045 TaxID=3346311 RepID=UPI0036E711FB